jgi:hypothetical protein
MRSTPNLKPSLKRNKGDFAQEIEYKPTKKRRGARKLQAVPAAITPAPTPSSSHAPGLFRPSQTPQMDHYESHCTGELPDEEPRIKKRRTGQVMFCLWK